MQKESDVPDTTALQLSLNAQSTGEPHVQILSVPQDTTQGQERLQSLSDIITPDSSITQVKQSKTQAKTFIETLIDEQKQIEKATRGQSANPIWFEQKQNRITASNCKDVFSHMNSQRSNNN